MNGTDAVLLLLQFRYLLSLLFRYDTSWLVGYWKWTRTEKDDTTRHDAVQHACMSRYSSKFALRCIALRCDRRCLLD